MLTSVPAIVEQMVHVILVLKTQRLSILLSGQNMRYAERVFDRAYVLEKGQIRHHAAMSMLAKGDGVQQAYLGV